MRYAIAPLAMAVVMLVQRAFLPQPGVAPFVFLFFGVTVAALVGGRGPGLLAAAVGATGGNFLFIAPFNAWALDRSAVNATLMFAVSSGATALLVGSLRAAMERADEGAKLVRLSHDAIFTWEVGGPIDSWNHGAEALYGWTGAEAIGRNPHELLSTRFPAPLATILAELRRRGDWEGELRQRTRDRRAIVVLSRLQLVRGRSGRDVIFELNRDVTDRVRVEASLRESEERLRLAQEVAHVGSFEWRPGPGVSADSFVPAAPPGGPVSWTDEAWPHVVPAEDRAEVQRRFSLALETGVFEAGWRAATVGGPPRWFIGRGSVFRDESGAPTRLLGVTIDVTDSKRAETEREALLEALREADRRKDEFLGVLSHELRNPLAPIRNSAFLLGRLPFFDERGRKALAVIDRQVGQLARLVEDLLDVTRITRGKIRLQIARLDLVELVERAVEDHRPAFEAAGVRLSAELPTGPLWVDGDPARLAQIAGNLLHNASKFTLPGGSVTLRLYRDGGATLEVADTGVGLDEETLGRLFQPFAQADRSLDRSRGGLGLGLALVKGLAELHHGEVRAESEGPGKGARFLLRIPVAQAPAVPPPAPGSAPGSRAAPGRSVVIVEDNLDAARTLEEVLVLGGHRVQVALDGRAGLAAIREHRPEVVVCDLGLPDVDGFEVARTVRQDRELAWTYLIALSGYAQPEDRRRAEEAGFDRHLAKPPDLGELERLIAEAPARATG